MSVRVFFDTDNERIVGVSESDWQYECKFECDWKCDCKRVCE